jgi:hypothetical protein
MRTRLEVSERSLSHRTYGAPYIRRMKGFQKKKLQTVISKILSNDGTNSPLVPYL